MNFQRHYRVAALPFRDMPTTMAAAAGIARAEAAERRLRDRLAHGDVPEVFLVAPERARRSCISAYGKLMEPAHAWSGQDHGPLSSAWLHSPHASATIDAHEWHEDEHPFYAGHGSVVVTSGFLRGLRVAPWLLPVADQLAARYGVPVEVVDGPDVPMPHVPVADPIHLPNVLTIDERAMFRRHLDTNAGQVIPGRRGLKRKWVTPPDPYTTAAGELLRLVGRAYRLPVSAWQTAITEYRPGDAFELHADHVPTMPNTWDRTVSFSVLVSDLEDFAGGTLVVNGQSVPLGPGDVAGFTATTPHEVMPITQGRRIIWLGFGEVAR
ncbi:hypothetical protein G5V59_25660 [Nocardioides sp. W3-2-3]|uniref:2OG-Fe(II) oxygenase n=1 Tax=Nocardioides convexus TaxID=2712224 RepID=UPI0024188A19|nr:2OG-Fe(II) oxygenase [Nocardioides convexus]NHA01888.1 hypothetical protein [Nocardioides convexus]